MRLDSAFESAIVGIRMAPQVAKLKKATQGVEQIFVKQLLSQMRKSSMAEEDSHGMGMYKDMMDDALATAVAERGDFGIANQMLSGLEPILFKQELAKMRFESRALAAYRNNQLKTETQKPLDKEKP